VDLQKNIDSTSKNEMKRRKEEEGIREGERDGIDCSSIRRKKQQSHKRNNKQQKRVKKSN
jgi:hypothetical protein